MHRHAATGACRLGDDKAAIGFNLDDRKTHVGIDVADRLPVREVAAGALRAAFDDVTGQRAGGELVVVVLAPAEFVHQRTEHHSRIETAARDEQASSEEHTYEIQKQKRHTYAVFCYT